MFWRKKKKETIVEYNPGIEKYICNKCGSIVYRVGYSGTHPEKEFKCDNFLGAIYYCEGMMQFDGWHPGGVFESKSGPWSDSKFEHELEPLKPISVPDTPVEVPDYNKYTYVIDKLLVELEKMYKEFKNSTGGYKKFTEIKREALEWIRK